MIAMNHQFVRLSCALRGWKMVPLAPILQKIVSAGFKWRNDCVLLAYFADKETNASVADLYDKTGYEAFLNHVHIEKYADSDIGRNALQFAVAVLIKWQEEGQNRELNALVSLQGDSATVRFHLQRPGEFWVDQNLDGYSEAVLTVSSSDCSFLAVL